VAGRDLDGFVDAGRTLYSLGLVKGREGNLSSFDGFRLLITRAGCRLASLEDGDVLEGTLDVLPEGASSDGMLHVAAYGLHGPGAFAHAHPAGSVPPDWAEGEPHGTYAFGGTLDEAVEEIVQASRGSA
jgi:ribulose-5-phosphate 4-epimerase/fuculose-1-phosphate aldolase